MHPWGAEILAEGLMHALHAQGHEAEIAAIPFKWYPQYGTQG